MSPWPLPPGPPSRPGQCLFLPCLPRAPRCLQAPLLLSQAYPLLPRTRAPRHQARGLGMEGCLAHERGAGPGTWEGRRRSGLRPATVRRRRGRIRPRRGARGGAGRAPPPAPRDVTDSPGVQASGSPSGSPTRVGRRGLSLASHTDPGAGPAAGHLSRQQLRRRLEPPRRGILAEAAAARLGAPRGPPGWGAGGGASLLRTEAAPLPPGPASAPPGEAVGAAGLSSAGSAPGGSDPRPRPGARAPPAARPAAAPGRSPPPCGGGRGAALPGPGPGPGPAPRAHLPPATACAAPATYSSTAGQRERERPPAPGPPAPAARPDLLAVPELDLALHQRRLGHLRSWFRPPARRASPPPAAAPAQGHFQNSLGRAGAGPAEGGAGRGARGGHLRPGGPLRGAVGGSDPAHPRLGRGRLSNKSTGTSPARGAFRVHVAQF